MSNNNNESKHIDKLVIYLFLGAFLISAGTLAFKITKKASCEEVLFTHDSSTYRAGEIVIFSDKTDGAKEWDWEFGDSTEVDNTKNPTHVYKNAGNYKIKLLVNGFCERIESITIKDKRIIRDSTKYPVFTLPATIIVGQTLKVKDETENADTWEWRFGDNARVDSKEKRAEYVYDKPGLRTVSLIVNGLDEYQRRRKIEVIPIGGKKSRITEIGGTRERGDDIQFEAPTFGQEGVVEKKKEDSKPLPVPYITDRLFGLQLVEIAKEKVRPQDLGRKYFCGELDMQIRVNGDNTTFLLFCESIKGKKKLKNLNVEIIRGDSPVNCIETLTITYKKGLF